MKKVVCLFTAIMIALAFSSCANEKITKEKAAEIIGVSFEDFWEVQRIFARMKLQGIDGSKMEDPLDFDDPYQAVDAHNCNRAKETLSFTEAQMENGYLRQAVKLDEAKKHGYNENSFYKNQSAYSIEQLTGEATKDKLYEGSPEYVCYEQMEQAAARKKMSLDEFVQQIVFPIDNLMNADVVLQNYFWKNYYKGNFKMGTVMETMDDYVLAKEFFDEYEGYVDELTKNRIQVD